MEGTKSKLVEKKKYNQFGCSYRHDKNYFVKRLFGVFFGSELVLSTQQRWDGHPSFIGSCPSWMAVFRLYSALALKPDSQSAVANWESDMTMLIRP